VVFLRRDADYDFGVTHLTSEISAAYSLILFSNGFLCKKACHYRQFIVHTPMEFYSTQYDLLWQQNAKNKQLTQNRNQHFIKPWPMLAMIAVHIGLRKKGDE